MVDWKSPAEIAKDTLTFDKFTHTLIGVYIWEWVLSFGFDWDLITRKKPFRWPMVFYLLNRYCMLFSLTALAVALSARSKIDCQALYTFLTFLGTAAVGLASINLSIRTMAVWSRRWYIVVPLVVIILGHWSLLLHGVRVKSSWIPGQGCIITNTNTTVLVATWIYTMIFDFIVLSLMTIKLRLIQSGSGLRSKLVNLIFKDGLIFFIIAFLSNVIATTFMLLNLNPVMSIIANVPSAIISTIVACRVVRRLNNFTSESFTSTAALMIPVTDQVSNLTFESQMNKKISTTEAAKAGVRVQMETFEDKTNSLEYDAAGHMGKNDSYDPESQAIRNEFKRPPY